MTKPTHTLLDDGRALHTFRQSTLEQFSNCLERGRLTITGQMPKVESDAACLGTAVHEAIEYAVLDYMDTGGWMSAAALLEIALRAFEGMAEGQHFKWIKYTPTGAARFIERAINAWWTEVRPTLQPLKAEMRFGPLTLISNDERVVKVTGTMDYFDAVLGLCDWKTASQDYKRWEKQRWAIQPTVYTWAAVQLGLLDATAPPWTFTYFVMRDNGAIQQIEVTRHAGDHDWLVMQADAYARLLESGLPSFPRIDNHALCSAKWCPAWLECKGSTRDSSDNY